MGCPKGVSIDIQGCKRFVKLKTFIYNITPQKQYIIMEFYVQASIWYRYLGMLAENTITLISFLDDENVLGRKAVEYSDTISKFCVDNAHFLPELSEGDYYYSFSEPASKNNISMRYAFKYVISCYQTVPHLFEKVDQLCKKKLSEKKETHILQEIRNLNRNFYETMNMEIDVEIYSSNGSVDMAKITRF